MLSILAREEDPKLEEEKVNLMYEKSQCQQKLAALEQNILHLLQTTEGARILDDEALTEQL
jgi:dynein heavy chain